MNRHTVILCIVFGLALAAAPPGTAKPADLKADHPVLALLAASEVTRGREHRALLIHPIVAEARDPDGFERALTAKEAADGEWLVVAEPEKKKGAAVEVVNFGTRPILLLSGEVLEGGVVDRFLARDVLLLPASRAVAPAYPGAAKPRLAAEAKKLLEPREAVAPDFLRLLGAIEGPTETAIEHLTDLIRRVGDGDGRAGLPALFAAKDLAERIDDYRGLFAAIPDEGQSRTIGVAAWVGDRLVGIDLFGTNQEFRAHWPKLLSTLAWQAALNEKVYGLLKQPFPAGRDPDRKRTVTVEFLRKVFGARGEEVAAVSAGTEILLRREELVGRVLLTKEDRVAHLFLTLDMPAPDAEPPPSGDTPEVSPDELTRRLERGGRLTEYEKRLLERLRERRRAPPPVERPGSEPRPGVPEIGGR